ncbi:MAG: hypothetical protein AAF411_04825 [Myxococcota bacterium]
MTLCTRSFAFALGALLLVACSPSGSGPAPRATDPLVVTDVPVLLFPSEMMRTTVVTGEAAWYGLSYSIPGLTVYLHATVNFVDAPSDIAPVETELTVRGVPALETVNEGIQTVSWVESDAAYALDAECADAEDTRCTNAEFLINLAERMVAQ